MSRAPTAAFRVSEHDSPLGRWTITVLEPAALLRGIVRTIWHGEGRVAYVRDRILPGAQSYLLFNLGPPQYLVAHGTERQRVAFDDAWFCGISERPIDAEAPYGSVVVGVELTTVGAAAILPLRQSEAANRVAPLADLLGRPAQILRERLGEAASAHDRLMLVQQWLLGRCMSGRRVHPLVHWTTTRLAACGGAARVDALARGAGCSRKHLADLFAREVGLAPKALARVLRFRRALDARRAAPGSAWSDIAASCGYFDQAHLIRDFREFAGMSPTELDAQAMPDPASVVVR